MYQTPFEKKESTLLSTKNKGVTKMKITRKQIIMWTVSVLIIALGIVLLICLYKRDFDYTVYVPILMTAIALSSALILSSILDIVISTRQFGEQLKSIKKYNYLISITCGLCILLPLIIILCDGAGINPAIYLAIFISIQVVVAILLIFCIIKFAKFYKTGIKLNSFPKQ
jgi:hypothetical protein